MEISQSYSCAVLVLAIKEEDAETLLPTVDREGMVMKRTPLVTFIQKIFSDEEKCRQEHIGLRPGEKVKL